MNKQHSTTNKTNPGPAPEIKTGKTAKAGKKKADRKVSLSKKTLPDGLKPKLQKGSVRRRKHQAALVQVEEAASRHGRNDLQPTLKVVEKPIDALKPVNRRSIGTPYRRAKGTPLALHRSIDVGRGFRAAGGVGRA